MGVYRGIHYNLRGFFLALKTPKLLILGLIRFAVILIITLALSGVILVWHEQILSMIWEMPESGWIIYLWKVVSWILSFILAAVSMVLSYLIAQLFFCVFIMDYMSRITEKIATGKEEPSQTGSIFGLLIYLIKQEIPRALIPVIISIAIMLVGLLTPLSPVILFVSSMTAAVFLAWDNTDLTPARRMIPFRRRIQFLKQNIGFHIGFGLLFLIPGVNIVLLSFAPVGATLYYVEYSRD